MIDESRLIEAIRSVAATEPDLIYPGSRVNICRYRPSKNSHCGCLVGEALFELEVPILLIEELDEQQADVTWGQTAVARILAGELTEAALNSPWVKVVQLEQDTGVAWGEAVAIADAMAHREGWVGQP